MKFFTDISAFINLSMARRGVSMARTRFAAVTVATRPVGDQAHLAEKLALVQLDAARRLSLE
jgi:hypothetical protein